MADKEARIRIGIENSSQTIADLMKITGAFRAIGGQLQGVAKLAKDASSAVANIKPFDPKQQTDHLEQYRLTLSRLTVMMGTGAGGVDALRRSFDKLSTSSGFKADDIASATEHYGRLTYNLKGAADGMTDLLTAANNFNRTPMQMVESAAGLVNNLGVPHRDVGAELRQIGRIADRTGTQGGRMGLLDAVTSLGPQIQKFDTSTPEARSHMEAFIASAGKGMPHDAATEAAGAALGWFSGEALGLGKYLGRKSLVDKKGKVEDPGKILDAVKRKMRMARDKAAALRVLGNYVNLQAAPNLFSLSSSELSDLAANPEAEEFNRWQKDYNERIGHPKPEARAIGAMLGAGVLGTPPTRDERYRESDQLMDTPAGRLEKAQREIEKVQRDKADILLRGRDTYQKQYEGKRGQQVIDETILQTIKDTPGISVMGDLVHGLTAAGAVYQSPDEAQAPAGGASLVGEVRETTRAIREQTTVIRAQGHDRNSSDVHHRKRAHQ